MIISFLFIFTESINICIDDILKGNCEALVDQRKIEYHIINESDIINFWNESQTSLKIAIFKELVNPLIIPQNAQLNSLEIISNFQEVEFFTPQKNFQIKELITENVTLVFSSNNDEITLESSNILRNNSIFKTKNSQKLILIPNGSLSINSLENFDELIINSSDFSFIPISEEPTKNISLLILSDCVKKIEFTSEISCSIFPSLNYFLIQYKNSYLNISTSLNLTFIYNHNSYEGENDVLNIISKEKSTRLNVPEIKVLSGNLKISGDWPNLRLTSSDIYLLNSTTIELDAYGLIPYSLIVFADVKVKSLLEETTIDGFIFFNEGNLSISSMKNSIFSCSAVLNYSEYGIYQSDMTEAEFFQHDHQQIFNCYLEMRENIIFYPKFLINPYNIIGGTTTANLINDFIFVENTTLNTVLQLNPNGTAVISYHVNFNETYEEAMKIHHRKYDQLVEQGLNKTFDFDNFQESFKYYYLKYIGVFSNFSRVFSETKNQFYSFQHYINENLATHQNSKISRSDISSNYKLFIQRDDTPIHAFYRTSFISLICNVSCSDYSIEMSDSKFLTAEELELDGEFRCYESCIQYRLKEIPTSASELFVFCINIELIDSLKNVPFITILTPTNIQNFISLMRNKNSRNIILFICESMDSQFDLTKIRADSNLFLIGLSVKNANDYITFFNTIRKSKDLKSDLKKAIDAISPKIPEIFPSISVNISDVQSVTAIGLSFKKSIIQSGSTFLSLCNFSRYLFITSEELISDLYSINSIVNNANVFKFINTSIIPNYVNKTSDLLSIYKVDFDENGWYFYSKGTLYNDVIYNFGLPYIIADNQFSIYSITDGVEYCLTQTNLPVKAINFTTGRTNDNYNPNMAPLLSYSNQNIIEIPKTTKLWFSGDWNSNSKTDGQFYFDFGNSTGEVEILPPIKISFCGNNGITFKNDQEITKYLKVISGSGNISIVSENPNIEIDSLIFYPSNHLSSISLDSINANQIKCLKHSFAALKKVNLHKSLKMMPNSSLEVSTIEFSHDSNVTFHFNFDYKLPFLHIKKMENLPQLIKFKFEREYYSRFNPNFDKNLMKSYEIMKVNNQKCESFNNLILMESDFVDFNDQSYLRLDCIENKSEISLFLVLNKIPSLKFIRKNLTDDRSPRHHPNINIPSRSPTPKSNENIAIIAGGVVGGIAFLGIIIFIVFFVITGKREAEGLLDTRNENVPEPL
ncbi:hypothetical protein TRFO_39281 [Tritrichomonas foetus]|uniref:Uncharacterized protein n=1 Tax=Tritrichomonas foetus TaxID=1144522 RepID=A0A1J4JAU2_9EUKA|nr:hypothetical protein TRFO_39281 [Tritrichomonas foetus]|eukprot:OHS94549.1 hypothetical protein TRFO_39281 [Tritrichomonas foetus]